MTGKSSNQRWLDRERDRDREHRIWTLRQQGMTHLAISLDVGISPSRVGQILARLKREQERT